MTGKERDMFFRLYFPFVFRIERVMVSQNFEGTMRLVRAVRLVDPDRCFTTDQGYEEARHLFKEHEKDFGVRL